MSQVQSLEKSTRVNASMLPLFKGKMVRLTGKVVQVDKENGVFIVEASDGGQVAVLDNKNVTVKDPIVEVIGKVIEDNCISMATCVNMGCDLDLKLVNDVVNLIHDPRFFGKIF
ncbi:hypothetical protein CVT26_010487 [Gymnopilus dilepis]|uniref:Replication factor A protein 3 n=1 Tax=Gymnopilus dilepis TaxID=231916 RepID=A0A409Y0M0_9AGAR|nr:hypothetical protein CVT26_010487 [Gymnopilus dilepis]